ncbi:hypothetical protein HQ47_02795 [Porphyromonas macacae]|uniref:Uncharacterized protein n=1 Tax=Porphyromonas macacae TaxID=28115 RepID=A0A0A2E7K3_9PORP|nr:hypothetical protein HQ47_02795 [Porphyromonas macacae]
MHFSIYTCFITKNRTYILPKESRIFRSFSATCHFYSLKKNKLTSLWPDIWGQLDFYNYFCKTNPTGIKEYKNICPGRRI